MKKDFSSFRHFLPDVTASLCTLFMLCLIPLLFHDAFFDINRIKVNAVITAIPCFLLLMILAISLDPARNQRRVLSLREGIPCIIMLLFMGACIASCALAGFEEAVLTGSEGRYCGLVFMLSCACAFFIIVFGRVHIHLILPAVMITSAICALLGVLNSMGIDPLGFYDRIQKGQEKVFLSTIGHFDFFGTFLVLLFPLSAAQFVYSSNRIMRCIGLFSATLIAFGATISRTDSAFAGLHMACFMIAALSGGDWAHMTRALLIWALSMILLPIGYTMLQHSVFHPEISGLPKILFQMHAGECLFALFLLLAFLCAALRRRGMKAPGRNKLLRVSMLVFLLFVLAAFSALIWFSCFDTQTPLGSASSFLRFNDRWGSLRGFVYTRSLRAFGDYSLIEKLFGIGMDISIRALSPYFDDPAMLVYGVFNDPHCQPLQMLLTCGITGMIAFLLLYASMFFTFFRHAGDDPILCGVLGSVFSYSLIMMINVTQPILILTYFSVCALGLSHLRAQTAKGGITHES